MIKRLLKTLDQRNNRKEIYSKEDYWDSKAAELSNSAVSMWANESLNELYDIEQKRLIRASFPSFEGFHILDLGCGTGRLSRWFANENGIVTGVDFSNKSLEIARKLSSTAENPVYKYGSVFELSDHARYDIVFTWGVLTIAATNRAELLNALQRIHRSLKRDGTLMLMEPIHRGFLHRVLDLSLSEFIDVLSEAGFTVKKKSPLHFWPVRLLLAYIRWPAAITVPVYHVGQMVMKLPYFNMLGDYWVIVAEPRR